MQLRHAEGQEFLDGHAHEQYLDDCEAWVRRSVMSNLIDCDFTVVPLTLIRTWGSETENLKRFNGK